MAKYSENYNLILPEAEDYYDVAVFNENFSCIDKVMNSSGNDKIIIASYDTSSNKKAKADYVCTSTNAAYIIQQAIDEAKDGDEILLLRGTYNIRSTVEINKGVTITGKGMAHTALVKEEDNNFGPIFNITGLNVRIEKLMLCEYNQSSGVRNIILMGGNNIILKEVFFVQRGKSLDGSAIVKSVADCYYSRIQDCRIYRDVVDDNIMFDLSAYGFSGAVLGNILSGASNISLNFNNDTSRNNTAVYGNHSIEIYVNNVRKE